MKKIYNRPETLLLHADTIVSLLTGSTEWYENTGGPDQKIDDETEPNPSGGSGAKQFWGTDDNLWGDEI